MPLQDANLGLCQVNFARIDVQKRPVPIPVAEIFMRSMIDADTDIKADPSAARDIRERDNVSPMMPFRETRSLSAPAQQQTERNKDAHYQRATPQHNKESLSVGGDAWVSGHVS